MKESLTTVDLAQYENPVSQIFRQPATAEEWESYILSKEQVQFYETYGFLSGIKMLSNEQNEVFNKKEDAKLKLLDKKIPKVDANSLYKLDA